MDAKDRKIQITQKWIRWGGTILSGLLFLWIIWRQDWDLILQNLKQLSIVLLVVVFFLYLGVLMINALRWYSLLKAVEIRLPFKQSVKIVFLGAFVSNFLPSTIGGDGMRFISLLHYTADRVKGGASVVLDRLISMTAMLILLPVSVITFSGSIAETLQMGMPGISTLSLFGVKIENTRGGQLISKFKRVIKKTLNAFQDWFRRPYSLLLAIIISWLALLIYFLGIWLIAQGLGIDVAFYQVTGVTVITYLVTLLPISVNGYGVREVAVTALYVRLGASLEQASTLAVVTRFIYLLATLPGAIWLSQVGLPQRGTDNIVESFEEYSEIDR